MEIKVKGIKHNVGYALWALNRLPNETEQAFLDRAIRIDNALRECDEERAEAKLAEWEATHPQEMKQRLIISIPKLPRVNPRATAVLQGIQLREQLNWLKRNGFKGLREAQAAGY